MLGWKQCICIPGVTEVVKSAPANAEDVRDVGSNPGFGRTSGERQGNPLQYSCLKNPIDREAWHLLSIGSQKVGHNWSGLVHTNKEDSGNSVKLLLKNKCIYLSIFLSIYISSCKYNKVLVNMVS